MIEFINPHDEPITGEFNLKAFNIVYDEANYDIYYNCGNKLKSKKTAADIIGEEYVLPVLATGDTYQEAIDASGLTNGIAKYNLFSSINFEFYGDKIPERRNVLRLLDIKNSHDENELHYWWRGQEPKWFVERLLEGPVDNYRFYCYKGQIMCVYQVNYDKEKRCMVTYPNLRIVDWVTGGRAGGRFHQPRKWKLMVKMVEKLCEPFPLIRIDMMVNDNNIYFSEFTPTFGGFYAYDEAQEPLVKLMETIDANVR